MHQFLLHIKIYYMSTNQRARSLHEENSTDCPLYFIGMQDFFDGIS